MWLVGWPLDGQCWARCKGWSVLSQVQRMVSAEPGAKVGQCWARCKGVWGYSKLMDSHKSDLLFKAREGQSVERIRKAARTLNELGSRQSIESYIVTCVEEGATDRVKWDAQLFGLSPCGQACCTLCVGKRWIQHCGLCAYVCVCVLYCVLLTFFVDQATLAVCFCGDFCDPRINQLIGRVFNP